MREVHFTVSVKLASITQFFVCEFSFLMLGSHTLAR
jgi:hypothetical protein